MSVEASRTCFLIDSLLNKKPKEELETEEEDEEEDEEEELSSSEVTRWADKDHKIVVQSLLKSYRKLWTAV